MPRMEREIRIGFVGAGANTRLRHLPGFAAIPGVRLAAVANRTEASARAVAAQFGIARVARDWRAVVEDPEVDAVCIGTWPNLHAEVTCAALAAGKHVLCEARMAADLAGARAMLAASAARPDLVAQLVPAPFTLDLDATIIGLLREGALGELREILVEHAAGWYADPDAPLSWRQDPACSGVNMLFLGICHETVQRWLGGPFAVEAARGAVFTRERAHWESGARVRVELPDCLHVLGRGPGGARLAYRLSGVERGPGRHEFRLVGAGATLRVDAGRAELYLSGRDGVERPVAVPPESRRGWRVEADFIASIRTGAPVTLTSFADGVRYMEFTDAVFRGMVDG